MGRSGAGAGGRSCRGAILLLTLFAVAALGVLLTVAGRVWLTDMRREREAELLFVGREYVNALSRYSAATPAGGANQPERLDQLLLDDRQPATVRHLRRLYRDPLTGRPEWGLIKAGNRIVGVYSLGAGVPVKQAGFSGTESAFNGAKSYADWRFVVAPAKGPPAAVEGGSAGEGAPTPVARRR